jgi:hypothetical protein
LIEELKLALMMSKMLDLIPTFGLPSNSECVGEEGRMVKRWLNEKGLIYQTVNASLRFWPTFTVTWENDRSRSGHQRTPGKIRKQEARSRFRLRTRALVIKTRLRVA